MWGCGVGWRRSSGILASACVRPVARTGSGVHDHAWTGLSQGGVDRVWGPMAVPRFRAHISARRRPSALFLFTPPHSSTHYSNGTQHQDPGYAIGLVSSSPLPSTFADADAAPPHSVFEKHNGPIEFRTNHPVVQQKDLKPGEALVNIKYSGVCHTDLHALKGDWPAPPKLPLVGGHEGAGCAQPSQTTSCNPRLTKS